MLDLELCAARWESKFLLTFSTCLNTGIIYLWAIPLLALEPTLVFMRLSEQVQFMVSGHEHVLLPNSGLTRFRHVHEVKVTSRKCHPLEFS